MKTIEHDNKTYREIEFLAGAVLDKCIERLQSSAIDTNMLLCGSFNGHVLYSDTVTLDSAYLEICGRTKSEDDAFMKKEHENYLKREEEHKAKIPELTKEWVEKGKQILDIRYHDLWEKCVPIRLGDLYKGMELGCTLDIVKLLNEEKSFDECNKVLENQGHSGMSYSLVVNMIESFSERGKEFHTYLVRRIVK